MLCDLCRLLSFGVCPPHMPEGFDMTASKLDGSIPSSQLPRRLLLLGAFDTLGVDASAWEQLNRCMELASSLAILNYSKSLHVPKMLRRR